MNSKAPKISMKYRRLIGAISLVVGIAILVIINVAPEQATVTPTLSFWLTVPLGIWLLLSAICKNEMVFSDKQHVRLKAITNICLFLTVVTVIIGTAKSTVVSNPWASPWIDLLTTLLVVSWPLIDVLDQLAFVRHVWQPDELKKVA